MKKTILIMAALLTGMNLMAQKAKTFHDFSAETIDGEMLNFKNFKGKKVLVVNVASKCGLTPQYEQLEELYKTYGGENFTIIGFPANNFLKQEPGSNAEIKEFCKLNYGVTFQIMSKISVKGEDIHPVYKWLTKKAENGVMDAEVSWNFQKFLIDENGKLIAMFPPKTSPMDAEIIKMIQK